MEPPIHTFSELIAQPELDNSPETIEANVREHSPLAAGKNREEAPFWSADQVESPQQALTTDSDWTETVNDMNTEPHR